MIKPKECQKMGGEKRGFSPPSTSPCPLGFIVLSGFFPQSLWVCVGGGMRLPPGRPTWHAVGTGKVRPGGEERELPERFFLHTAPPHPHGFLFPVWFIQPGWAPLTEDAEVSLLFSPRIESGVSPGNATWGQFQMVPDGREEQRNSVIRKAERESQGGRSYYFPARWRALGGWSGKGSWWCVHYNKWLFFFLLVPGLEEEGGRWECSCLPSLAPGLSSHSKRKGEGGGKESTWIID